MRKCLAILITAAAKQFWQRRQIELESEVTELHRLWTDPHTTCRSGHAEVERELQSKKKMLQHVNSVVQRAEVIEPATDTSRVDINTIVTYRIESGSDEKKKTILIGEHAATDLQVKPPVMSYDSNLLTLALMGRRKGERFDVQLLNGEELEVTVLDISLPTEQPVLKIAA